MDKNEKAISLINHYQNEWIHRHAHYWKVLSSMCITNLIIICFPICCSYFDIKFTDLNINPKIFPIVGILYTVVCCSLLIFESKKLIHLRNCINTHLKQIENISSTKNKQNFISTIINHINFIVAIILAIAMIVISIYFICVL